jgi:uncharacterized protein (TIGR03000 family)
VIYAAPGYSTPAYPPGSIEYSPSGVMPETNQIPPAPANGGESEPTPADDATPPGPARTGTDANPDDESAILNLRLPVDSVVYVNGKRTRTPGDFRSYVSRNLEPGKLYTYEIRAEVERDGETLTRTKVVELAAGLEKTLDIDFNPESQLITSVTLNVPDDARVQLGGVETGARGAVRYFSTSTLKAGDSWNDYVVAVTVVRDGQEVTQTRTVNVRAGDSLNLDFDFDNDERVAAR